MLLKIFEFTGTFLAGYFLCLFTYSGVEKKLNLLRTEVASLIAPPQKKG